LANFLILIDFSNLGLGLLYHAFVGNEEIIAILTLVIYEAYLDTEGAGGLAEDHHLVRLGQVSDIRAMVPCWRHLGGGV